jgi:alpha,alpha-trehalose phosphorylase
MAAEFGHLQLAYHYFGEAALLDLDDLEHNTRDGLHIASPAGAWIAAVAGFGGMRDYGGSLRFTPRLPNALTRLTFRICFRGRRLLIDVRPKHATYSLRQGAPLEIFHYGEQATLAAREPLTRPIPPVLARETPKHPPGRELARRVSAKRLSWIGRRAA